MWRAIGGSRVWQALTIVLGAAFLAGQGSQYVRLIRDGVTIGQGLFGTTFFTLVGAHGLHVLAGLVALAVVPSTRAANPRAVLVFLRGRMGGDLPGSLRLGRGMNVWDWEPSVVIGCAALAIGYIALVRERGFHRAPYFLAGVLLLLLDLVSPIDTLGDQYLFSAHIVQHFLLALVIPPLLLLGTPRFDLGQLNQLERVLGQPPVSWLLGVGTCSPGTYPRCSTPLSRTTACTFSST